MKTKLYFTLTLLTFVTLAFVPKYFAKDTVPEYVVRVIYLIPNDQEPDPNMDEKLDTMIKESQAFYADQMEVHGFGRKTFRYEADDAGNLVVHHINGRHDDAYYQNAGLAWNEILEQFDTSKNIHFLALGISSNFLYGSDNIYGTGGGNSQSGKVTVPASNLSASIHELGHAFGLSHDSRFNGKRVYTSRGVRDWMTTSFCAAQWLDVHRYFNPMPEAFNNNTSVQNACSQPCLVTV